MRDARSSRHVVVVVQGPEVGVELFHRTFSLWRTGEECVGGERHVRRRASRRQKRGEREWLYARREVVQRVLLPLSYLHVETFAALARMTLHWTSPGGS